jgi:glycosyltransferase involved in cell wall biosynthesis
LALNAKKLNKLLFYKIKSSDVCFEHAFHHMQWLKNKGMKNVYYFPVNVVNISKQIAEKKRIQGDTIKIGLLGNVNGIATLSGILDFFENYINLIKKESFFSNLEFNIIGGGDLRPSISKAILNYNNIKKLGYFEDINEIYELNDIILVPTPINLGFRTRIVEAFSFGACVITHKANSNAMPEFLINNNGFVYSNPVELIELLKKVSDNPHIIDIIGKNAKISYLKNLNGDLIGEQMIKILEASFV